MFHHKSNTEKRDKTQRTAEHFSQNSRWWMLWWNTVWVFDIILQTNNFEEEIKDAKTSFSADTRTRHGQRGVLCPSLVVLHAFLWNTFDFMSGINLNLLGSYYKVKKFVSFQPIISSRYLPKTDKIIKITVTLPLNHVWENTIVL